MRIIGKVFIGEKNPDTYRQDRQELVEKYKPNFKKITDYLLYMYTDIPQYQEFLQEIESRGQEHRVSYETEWSKKEMDGAEYLMIFTTNQIHEPLVDDPNTHYRPKSESCKKYVDQTSDLKIKKKYAGKWDFYFTYEMEFAVSPSLRELFEAEGIQGLSYRPIYTNRVEGPIGWQLVVTNELPPVHANMEKEVKIDCPDCGFRSYVREITENIMYVPEIREQAVDGFNRSSEYWGIGYYPRPLLIVSQRVRQLMLKHKIKGLVFEPVVIVE